MANHPILRGVKIGVKVQIFLLGVITIASILVFQNSRPTSAESFLYPLTCLAGKLIDPECAREPAQRPASPPATQPTSADQPTSAPPAAPAQPSESSQPKQIAQPLHIQPGELDELSASPSVPVNSDKSFPSAIGNSAQGLHVAFLGSQTNGVRFARPSLLQPSDHGWVILGIAWYWWLIAVVAVLAAAVIPRRNLVQSKLSKS